eukprot:gene8461-4904_t
MPPVFSPAGSRAGSTLSHGELVVMEMSLAVQPSEGSRSFSHSSAGAEEYESTPPPSSSLEFPIEASYDATLNAMNNYENDPAYDASYAASKEGRRTFSLISAGTTFFLEFLQLQDTEDLVSGLMVEVEGTFNAETNTILVSHLIVTPDSIQKGLLGQAPITSITFIVNICQSTNFMDLATFNSTWTNKYKPTEPGARRTMQDYYDACSYGKTSFTSENNVVVGPISLPCFGRTTWDAQWNSSLCGRDEIYGWAQAAEAYAVEKGIDLSLYSRRILVMPQMPKCQWAGLASVGCGRFCYTFIQGNYARSLETFFHELGHNLGLQHSATPTQEYGDCSCPLGACTGLRCFNAPHTWQAGWGEPIETFNKENLQPGELHNMTVPATHLTSTNMVRIRPDWLSDGPVPVYFISYREAKGGDSGDGYRQGLLSKFEHQVFVHIYNGSQGFSTERTELQATLTLGVPYVDSSGSLYITDVDHAGAAITIPVKPDVLLGDRLDMAPTQKT